MPYQESTNDSMVNIFEPSPLSNYRQLTTGGNVCADLTQDECATILKAFDYGLPAMQPAELALIASVIDKLKHQIWR